MRLYLIRHGQPVLPPGPRICLGRRDLALSDKGRQAAAELGRVLKERRLFDKLWISPLARCRETAAAVAPEGVEPMVVPAFVEIDAGRWDGRSFEDLSRDPAEAPVFRQRGEDLVHVPFPGGESFQDVYDRAAPVFRELTAGCDVDAAIVAHNGVDKALLSAATGKPLAECLAIPQDYCGVHCLERQPDGWWRVVFLNRDAEMLAIDGICAGLFARYQTPAAVVAHGEAVAETAMDLYARLKRAGTAGAIDRHKLYFAARIHDIARVRGRDHPAIGAGWLAEAGYPEIGRILAVHHDLPGADRFRVSERTLLYLADKYVDGDQPVSLARRFAASQGKCLTAEGQAAHDRRQAEAVAVEKLVREKMNGSSDL